MSFIEYTAFISALSVFGFMLWVILERRNNMECSKEEFEEALRQDDYQQEKLDKLLEDDYDYFLDYYQESLNNCVCAIKHLRDLHYKHNHPFLCHEIEDLI